MKIAFFEIWNWTPHLETSLELAHRHLTAGDEVYYYFLGHDVGYKEGLTYKSPLARWLSRSPERRGAALLSTPRFHFFPRVRLAPARAQWPAMFQSLDELKQIRYGEFDVGLGVVSSLVHRTRDSDPDLLHHRRLITSMLDSAVSVYAFTRRRIEQDRPDLVYTFNGRFANHRAVMRATQHSGVRLLLHERGADRSRYCVRPFMPHDGKKLQREMIAAWEAAAVDLDAEGVAHRFFRDRRAGREQGWRSFTSRQRTGTLPKVPADTRVITYFASSDDEYVAVGDIYRWEFWPDQYAAVLDLIGLCSANPAVTLVIRLHPHLLDKAESDRQRWLSLPRAANVLVVPPESEVDSYALIEASSIVVTAGSTVGIEAVYWGKPSINLGPSIYSELEATYQPKSSDELRRLLDSDQLRVDPRLAYPYGFYMSTFGEKFEAYRPESLFSGEFMGVDLQRPSPLLSLALRLRRTTLRWREA